MICRVLGYADFYALMENAICTGAYWYSYALTADEAKREADTCLKSIAGKRFLQ